MEDLALHIPTDVIDGPTSLVTALIAALAVAWCTVAARRGPRPFSRSARAEGGDGGMDERLVPLAGLATAFIFAAQMLNFPIAAGVSGHLLGGALAAALLGPWLGALCVTVVIVIQALLFADGAVTALGLNVANMALIATFTAYGVIALALKVLPRTRWGLGAAVFAASVVSVVAASAGFVLQFWIGGEPVGQSFGAIAGAILGTHVLVGIGEGVITAGAVTAVALARPDLVHALRGTPLAKPAPALKEAR